MNPLLEAPDWMYLPVADWVTMLVDWLVINGGAVFDTITNALRWILLRLERILLWAPWTVTIAVLTGVAWKAGSWRLAAGVAASMWLLAAVGMWDLAMATLALVLAATVLSVAIGIPTGIACARSDRFYSLIRPGLDFMQTMPSFVYLVPALMLFGLGRVPALVATIAYALPPVIRLTNLGIRQVPHETVEAGLSFGATDRQLLGKIQLPLAFPTIMAGVNQTIMMALAMVVIASMIGAGGLGREVLEGLARLDVGQAFVGGLSITVLAIVIDRISAQAGRLRRQGAPTDTPVSSHTEGATSGGSRPRSVVRAAPTATQRAPVRASVEVSNRAPAISVSGLTKIFGPRPNGAAELLRKRHTKREILERTRSTVALDDVTLDLPVGHTFVVMGLSGSGKSTLVRCVNRLVEPTYGRVLVDGEEITGYGPTRLRELRRRKFGMVFQGFALLPHRTVVDNVALGLELQGVGRDERRGAAANAVGLVGLDGWESSYPDELSGGMQQRVGLARALAHDPEILLMDEPFSALDPLMRTQMQDELLDLQARLRKTILFITHDLDEALKLGFRIAIMQDGRIAQVGTADEILRDPADDYVAAFVEGVDRSPLLCARDVMARPQDTLRLGHSPTVALRMMELEERSSSFAINRDGRLAGLVTADAAVEAIQRGDDDLRSSIITDVYTCSADTLVSDLYEVVAAQKVPIAVVDRSGRLLGLVNRVSVLRGLAETQKETRVGSDEPSRLISSADGH